MSTICRSLFSFSRLALPWVAKPPGDNRSLPHKPHERLPFDLSLYLVANRPSFEDESHFFSQIRRAVKGGVTCVQLRDHNSDLTTTVKTALSLKQMLQETGVRFFINTLRLTEVAREVSPDGVYLEENIPVSEVRRLLGNKIIIGIPVKTRADVIAAEHMDIDHISVKIFRSHRTCPRNDLLWSLSGLRDVRALSHHRIVGIGGLTLQQVEQVEAVYRTLDVTDGLAAAGGIMDQEDPQETAQKFLAICQKTRSRS
jgi:thiamine-phosphate pyrophosphorylase